MEVLLRVASKISPNPETNLSGKGQTKPNKQPSRTEEVVQAEAEAGAWLELQSKVKYVQRKRARPQGLHPALRKADAPAWTFWGARSPGTLGPSAQEHKASNS